MNGIILILPLLRFQERDTLKVFLVASKKDEVIIENGGGNEDIRVVDLPAIQKKEAK